MEQNNIEEIKKRAERSESQYNKLKQEFKDYIEVSRKNEEIKRRENKTDFAKRLLAVADSLNRVSMSYSDISYDIVKNYSENLKKNIDAVYSQFLSASGLTPIDPATGDKFDAEMHIAIGLEYGAPYPENSIFRVVRKGYRIEDGVVRPAEVIISKRPVVVIKPGLWDRLHRWISPSKFQFAEISQKIDELERIQKEKIEELTQSIGSLRDAIRGLEEKIALKEHAPLQQSDVLDDTGQYL